jgi:hypothetical protein
LWNLKIKTKKPEEKEEQTSRTHLFSVLEPKAKKYVKKEEDEAIGGT